MRDQDFFWEGVKKGQLLIQQCADCGALRQPPGPMCPQCQSVRSQAKAASGFGTLIAWIVSQHPTQPDAQPRIVVLIDLEEGVRMVSNLCNVDLAELNEGMPLQVFFPVGGELPHFRPVG